MFTNFNSGYDIHIFIYGLWLINEVRCTMKNYADENFLEVEETENDELYHYPKRIDENKEEENERIESNS